MKTKSLFFAALVMMSAVALAAGKDEPRRTGMAIVPVKGSEVFKVVYRGESAGKVRLNIYDAKANVILTETFNGTDGFIVPLNFAGLQFGEYTVELIDQTGKKVEKVVFQASKNEKAVHISKVSEGKFLLSVANTTAAEQITVKIFDENNNLIHSEIKEVAGAFAQVYKLKGTSNTFEISDNNGVVKTFKL